MSDKSDAVVISGDESPIGNQTESCSYAEGDDGEAVVGPPLPEPVLVFCEGDEVVVHQRRYSRGCRDHVRERKVAPSKETSVDYVLSIA